MNEKTFVYIVLFKWFELCYQIAVAFLIIVGTAQLSAELEN
jgi:hypothetical protein